MRFLRYGVPIGVVTAGAIIVVFGLLGPGGFRLGNGGRMGAVPLSIFGALIAVQLLWFVFLLSDR